MKHLFLVFIIYSAPVLSCKDILPEQPLKQEGIYILHTSGFDVLSQCARKSFSSSSVWTPTVKQVQIIDKKLKKHLEENKLKLVMTPESKYHRQYLGFEQNGKNFVYVNVYPTSEKAKRAEGTFPVVSCTKNNEFWGATFSIDTMQFESIDTNEPNQSMKKDAAK